MTIWIYQVNLKFFLLRGHFKEQRISIKRFGAFNEKFQIKNQQIDAFLFLFCFF
jgi:hypothetical protein